VIARNAPIPDSRRTRPNFQFRSAHLDVRRSPCRKPARNNPRQRRQSPGHDKQTMTLRAVPNNPSQRFVEKRQRVPAKKFQPKRFSPLIHQPFADCAQIKFVSLRSTVRIAPKSTGKSR
jgi:hypothetical protein